MATSASTNGVHCPIARLEGRPQKVRTVMLRNKLGLRKLPRTIRVKATCGHSLCCNPDHLEPARMRMIAVMASYS